MFKNAYSSLFIFFLCSIVFVIAPNSHAQETWQPNKVQEKLSSNPFIKGLLDRGVQLTPLGQEQGFDGWLMSYKGQVQIFYTVEGSNAVLSGFLIGEQGENLTALQIAKYQAISGNDIAEVLKKNSKTLFSTPTASLTPAEIFYKEASEAKWLSFGSRTDGGENKVFYVFMDPQDDASLSYFKALMKKQRDDKSEDFMVRVIPLAHSPESLAYLENIYRSKNSAELFYRTLIENKPLKDDLEEDAQASLEIKNILANSADILRKRDAEKLPLTLFKDGAGQIKLIAGQPKDLDALVDQ